MNTETAFWSLRPSPALAGHVVALHCHSGPVGTRPFRRLPGPFAALVIHRGEAGLWRRAGETGWRRYPSIALHGLSTVWSEAFQPTASPCLMALIEPWAVEPLFGVPGRVTIDSVIDLGACETLQAVGRSFELEALAAALESRIVAPAPFDLLPVLAEARHEAGSARVDRIARSAGLEARSLRRLFQTRIGVSPKRLFGIERFAANLRCLHPAPWNGSGIAPDYFDQAHEIREFRRFAGLTPGTYAREKRAGDRRVFAVG